MKKRYSLLLFMCIVLTVAVNAQVTVKYQYDNAGNRIRREIVLTTEKSVLADTTKEKTEPKPIEDQLGEFTLVLYPNPTHGQIAIEIKATNATDLKTDIDVYNTKGSRLQRQKTTGNTATIDLTPYPNGTYILKISVNGEQAEWKVFKQ